MELRQGAPVPEGAWYKWWVGRVVVWNGSFRTVYKGRKESTANCLFGVVSGTGVEEVVDYCRPAAIDGREEGRGAAREGVDFFDCWVAVLCSKCELQWQHRIWLFEHVALSQKHTVASPPHWLPFSSGTLHARHKRLVAPLPLSNRSRQSHISGPKNKVHAISLQCRAHSTCSHAPDS